MHAFVVGSRFGLLLGLALWLGVGVAVLMVAPLLQKKLPPGQAAEVVGATVWRLEAVLFFALGLVVLTLGARVSIDRAAPSTTLLLPVGAMVLARLLAALALSPALRAMRERLRDANAPATDAERAAFSRLDSARMLLVTLEVCLALYALFAVS